MEYPQVVRVFVTSQEPDYVSPWQSRSPSRSTGSGVIVDGNRVLTGAHVVANATFLQIQKLSHPDKIVATVERVCHDADLAVLRVDEPDALSDVEPAELGVLPSLRHKVSVVGFPVGGEEISVTEGVVSRIEVQRYSHSHRHLLAVTVDAAINEGNSGGPVFADGKVVGIAFQTLSGAENIGEMVPAGVIRQFLAGIAADKMPDIPGLGLSTQALENEAQRAHLGMSDEQSGVLVVAVEYGNSCYGVVKPGDILMEIDGLAVANNGTVRYQGRYRTRFDVNLAHHFCGDQLRIKLLRAGKTLEASVTLAPLRRLVPRYQYDQKPRYFVFAGLVFQALSRDFLTVWENWYDAAPKEFLNHYYSGFCTEERQEVVILTDILADKVNVGYDHLDEESVIAVNGQMPRDLRHFVELVEGAKDYIDIECSSHGRILVRTADVNEANARIAARYHLVEDRYLDEE